MKAEEMNVKQLVERIEKENEGVLRHLTSKPQTARDYGAFQKASIRQLKKKLGV